jgi:Domain of unknown function (DUF4340)
MTGGAGAARRRTVIWMVGGAVLAAVLGAVSVLPPAAPATRVEVGSLVLPGLADVAGEIGLVMVTTSEESYHLVKDPDGWVLPEKGRYRVRADRIEALAQALTAMRHARPMTRDARKFDRIGLGDPAAGGAGALLEVGNGKGETFAKLLVGYRNGTTYVREPDDLQAWAVDSEAMPPLQRGARWLDLDVVSLAAKDIREVEVKPAQGPGYRLLPADASGSRFGVAPPYDQRRLAASLAPTLVAGALVRFAPSDVMQAAGAGAALAGVHVTRTKTGLEIVATAWRRGEQGWVSVAADVAADAGPDVAAQADAINARASGWLFAMTETDWSAYAAPLTALVESASATSSGPRR